MTEKVVLQAIRSKIFSRQIKESSKRELDKFVGETGIKRLLTMRAEYGNRMLH